MNKINHFFKRFGQKIAISNYKKLNKADYIPRSDYELQAVRICRNLCLNPNSKLRVDPVLWERYLHNEEQNIVVFINRDSVDIIKNNYPQNVPLCKKSMKTILNIFDSHAHLDRVKYKDAVFSNLKLSLESIVEETKN